jgi:hypothetical protein
MSQIEVMSGQAPYLLLPGGGGSVEAASDTAARIFCNQYSNFRASVSIYLHHADRDRVSGPLYLY